jgi:hypothetical protein
MPMELPHSGTVRGSAMCSRRKASVAAPASSRVMVEARISSVRPLLACMSTTIGSIAASCSSVAWTTRSGPSATMLSSSSVMSVAISTITSVVASRPVISRSIHASTDPAYGEAPVLPKAGAH